MTSMLSMDSARPRANGAEDAPDLDDELELPVEPDDGSVIPDDDERVVNVPS